MDLASNSAVVPMYSARLDLLSALEICLFIPPDMDDLTFIFPHPDCTSIFPFVTQLKRVQQFIARLSSVKRVSLQLDSNAGGQCLSVGDDPALQAWASHFGGLLNCIVERKCTALTVTYGVHFTRAYVLNYSGFSRKYLPGTLRKLISPDTKARAFTRDAEQGVGEVRLPTSYSASTLTSLNIQSATLIFPPGLDWTLSALRRGALTSLAIRMSITEARTWSVVLPLIAAAAPHLRALSLTEVDLDSETDVITFLSRLPLLTDLEITHDEALWARNKTLWARKGPTFPLRHLVNLRAPAGYIDHFLFSPKCFPSIASICVLWTPPSPHLETPLFIHLVSSITYKLSVRRLSPRLTVSIDPMCGISPAHVPLLQNLTEERRASLERVGHIQMSGGAHFVQQAHNLALLLAMFRGADSVEITILDGAGAFPAEAVNRLASVVRPTEFLKTIQVNGENYILSGGT
ncbi:hypothetical protein C8R44DRAFT_880665 [Mycena epipterygia]|nr:hypothetical protein C8R44DRAFT_880665 [Mycena epipterygia]